MNILVDGALPRTMSMNFVKSVHVYARILSSTVYTK